MIIAIIIAYLITSFATARVLRYFNHWHQWAAWVPIYNYVCLTECIEPNEDGTINVLFTKIQKDVFKLWPVLMIIGTILTIIPFIGIIISVIIGILDIICYFVVYKNLLEQQSGKKQTILAIVCAIIQLVWIILCFVRFKDDSFIDDEYNNYDNYEDYDNYNNRSYYSNYGYGNKENGETENESNNNEE